jgi:hypothetical protein
VSAPAVLVVALTPDELRALIRDELRAVHAEREPAPSAAPLLDRRELGRTLAVSTATVTRLTSEGMPHVFVGDSPRYSIDEVRAWLEARGRQGTKAKPSSGPIPGVRLLSRGAK